MNIISEEQAIARQLALPHGGLLEGLPAEFIANLQAAGAFVEYNQQGMIAAGEVVDYVSCIVAGRTKIARVDRAGAKGEAVLLGAGEWFGAANLFVHVPSALEIEADGEVVIWTISAAILRELCFRDPQGTQLLFNFGVLLAEKLVRR